MKVLDRRGQKAIRTSSILAILLVALTLELPIAQSAIIFTGNVEPPNPSNWNSSTDGYIGKTANGSAQVDGGSQLACGSGFLGYNSGVTGTATIIGPGSKWTVGSGSWGLGRLFVGYSGTGMLTIQQGGQVSSRTGYIGYNTGSQGTVIVKDSSSKWTISGTLYMGGDPYGGGAGTGTLQIQQGAEVSNQDAYLAYNSGAQATVTISGSGSKWANTSLYVGYSGSGSLSIQQGGQVSTATGWLGYNSGSQGSATVTGSGSKWVNSGDLYVGFEGTGNLTVSDGGVVETKNLFASFSNLAGNGLIRTKGGVVDTNLRFDATHGLQQSVPFGSGGSVGLDINGTGVLGVGYKGVGQLTITDGKVVPSTVGYLGYYGGSEGNATISGAGSKWNVTQQLYVGYNGTGTLTIEQGATVSSATGYLGYDSYAQGTAFVRGSGSSWTISGDLSLGGAYGTGTLRIEQGAQVSNANAYLGTYNFSSATIIVSGLGSKWTNSGNLFLGYQGYDASGRLIIENGGEVSNQIGYIGYAGLWGGNGEATVRGTGSKWTNAGNLYVGYKGYGKLLIEQGGQVSNSDGYIGYSYGRGSVTIRDTNSTWMNSGRLYVGKDESGTLTIQDGAQVFSRSGWVANKSSFFSSSTVTVSGSGAKWINTEELSVGVYGKAQVTVEQAGQISSAGGYLGHWSGSQGTVTVTGTGSRWTNTGELSVGFYGTGTLKVEQGGQVANTVAYVGRYAGAQGTATVSGSGSQWRNTGALYVGYNSPGTMSIQQGGLVLSSGGYVGYGSGTAQGTATVTGSGSTWTNSGAVYVGYYGRGTLNISQGGQVSNGLAYIGYYSGSQGTVSVTGSGSKWTNTDLYVGYNGTGTLTVSNGGLVEARTIFLSSWSNLSGNGTIRANGIMTDGQLVFDTPGSSQSIPFGSGGTLELNLNGTGSLGVGYKGVGTLSITNGAAVRCGDGYLGYFASAQGSTTVSGSGTQWNNSRDLTVGYKGTGTLNITDGAQVSNRVGAMGHDAGSQGTVVLSGANSLWTNTGNLLVGRAGQGTLRIQQNARVTNASAYLGYLDTGTGTAEVQGGARWNSTGDLYIGYRGGGVLSVKSGSQVTNSYGYIGYAVSGAQGEVILTSSGTKWTNSASLYVGRTGTGSLTIQDGAEVSNFAGYIGYWSGSQGSAVVSGSGSKWTNRSDLTVGYSGNGSLTIKDGAQVTNRYGAVAHDAGTQATVLVQGSGSSWSHSGNFFVGRAGQGDMLIQQGAQVSNKGAYIGYLAGSRGWVFLETGGTWTNTGDLYIGFRGKGTLWAQSGAQITSGYGYIGYATAEAQGSVGLAGSGTKWTNSASVYVGRTGTGSLTIQDGAEVSNFAGYIGYWSGSQGSALVTTGSKWTNRSDLTVGYSGNGSLTIGAGGQVTSRYGAIAHDPNTRGTVRVIGSLSGSASTWTNTHNLFVGRAGKGQMIVEGGGKVFNAAGYIGYLSTADGVAVVRGAGSVWTNTGNLDVGRYGAGTLAIRTGGQVLAASVGVNYRSILSIDVGHGSLLSLGDGSGTLTNNGTVRILAGAAPSAGAPQYVPIAAGSWIGIGQYQAVGGTWDPSTHQFTVSDVQTGTSGVPVQIDLAQRQRVLITDPVNNWQLGASFLASATPKPLTVTATAISGDVRTALENKLDDDEVLYGGWLFTTMGNVGLNDPAYLSFRIGDVGESIFSVWRYQQASGWERIAPVDLNYVDPYISFTSTMGTLNGYGYAVVVRPDLPEGPPMGQALAEPMAAPNTGTPVAKQESSPTGPSDNTLAGILTPSPLASAALESQESVVLATQEPVFAGALFEPGAASEETSAFDGAEPAGSMDSADVAEDSADVVDALGLADPLAIFSDSGELAEAALAEIGLDPSANSGQPFSELILTSGPEGGNLVPWMVASAADGLQPLQSVPEPKSLGLLLAASLFAGLYWGWSQKGGLGIFRRKSSKGA